MQNSNPAATSLFEAQPMGGKIVIITHSKLDVKQTPRQLLTRYWAKRVVTSHMKVLNDITYSTILPAR